MEPVYLSIEQKATGNRIRELLKENGYTVKDIQKAMGFENPQAVYKWISGRSLPSLDNFLILSKILHTSIEDILVVDGDIVVFRWRTIGGDEFMVYITGDCHGNFERFDVDIFPEQLEMTKNDYVIICGDFGGIWDRDSSREKETKVLDELENKSFTTLFVDGNHENFDRLYRYPVEEWNGGKVHKIRPSVIHLMRGQVFLIAGKKILSFGGARSHDISGGILELDAPDFEAKARELGRIGKPYRINHLSWWEEEMPSVEEMEEGVKNLEANGNKVDFIVSHCCATSTQVLIGGGMFESDYLTDYFEQIRQRVDFKKWFFGHYHDNRNVNAQEILLYEQIIRIA